VKSKIIEMTLFLLAAAFFGLTACAQVSRAPSSAPLNITCDLALQYLGAEHSLSIGEDEDFRFATTIGHLHYLKDVYIPEVKKALPNPSEDTIAEFKRMQEDWKEFHADGKERVRAIKMMTAAIQNGPFFHDPDYGAKLACALKCEDPVKCEKKCKATGYRELSQYLRINKARTACSEIKGEQAFFKPAEFEAAFKKAQANLLERQKNLMKLSQEMVELEDKVEKAYAPLMKEMAKFKISAAPKKYEPTEFEKKMEPFVVYLDTGAGHGSGFLAKAASGTKLITAYHVFGYDLELNWGPEKIEVFFRDDLKAGKSSGREMKMKSEHGKFTRMNDVIENDYPDNREGFKVAGKGRLPAKGQKFFALGFPSSTEGYVRAIPCVFYGYTQSSQGKGTRYTFNCNSGRDRFPGMSGGPVVDEEGTVWGVNTNVGVITSRSLVASPIYRDDMGEIRFGLPSQGMSELCLNRKSWAAYESCQLMENQYETKIP
jgi:hypothetical protein